jgi:exonuclease SbcC
MIPIKDVVAKLATRYPNIEQVAETAYRVVDTYDGQPFAVRYFDLGDQLEAYAGQLHEYQDRLLGSSYYASESKADLRWNYYLYIVTSGAQSKAALSAKATVESDREYARKFVVTQTELDRVLNDRIFGSDNAEGLPPDALSIWTQTLDQHAMGFIVDQGLQVPAVTRHIAEGDRKPVIRPPTAPQLDSAERAAATEFLSSLTIKGFRNYPTRRDFDFGAVNLIVGVNGVGKTSLLEAIEFLFCGKTRRTESVPKGTDISGRLADSNLNLQTRQSTPSNRLRARHLAWYGKSELRTLTLDDSFSKFNFLDTDAAVRLSVEKSQVRIVDDLSQLLLGAEASKALDRFSRVLRQLGDDKKDLEKSIEFREERRFDAVTQLAILRNTPQASGSLYSDLLSALHAIGWTGMPTEKSQAARVSDSIHNALANIELLRNLGSSSFPDVKDVEAMLEALHGTVKTLEQLKEEAAVRTRSDKRATIRLRQIAKRMEALEALAPLVAAGITELVQRARALEDQINKQTPNIAAAEAAAANVPTDPIVRSQRLSVIKQQWTAAARTASIRMDSTARALTAFERTQKALISLKQRLRANAQEVLQHTGDVTHCPVCRAAYAQNELQAKLEELTESAANAESEQLRHEVQESQRQYEQLTMQLTAVEFIERYLAAAPNISLEDALKTIEVNRASLLGVVSDLQTVRGTLQAHATAGHSLERLEELAFAAELPEADRSPESIAKHQNLLRAEQLTVTANLERSASDAREASLRVTDISAALGVPDQTPEELERLVATRIKRLVDMRGATDALRSQIASLDTLSPSELQSRLQAINDIVVQLRTAIAKESQDSEAVKHETKRQTEAEAEIEGFRVRLNRVDNAISVLTDLLTHQSDRALSELVQRENATRISSTFAKIHAPNEFDLVMNGSLSIIRRESGKVELDEMSSGQRAAYALSLFLAMNERLTTGPKVLLFDDPVSHVDDINTLSLLDHLRDVALTNERQIFFATADSKIAALFARKFRFMGERFKQIELSRD